ncbi:SpoVR family protein [Derxia lacustris]|uniref:SpoVR family protein n=1 Tax=Derxia lacustris TaxID=764842 RepID=UPI000A16FDD1|nr:SpoVR family protein [Derxia lacustris]
MGYISTGSEWTFDLIHAFDKAIGEIALNEFKLDIYRNRLEVIGSEQMLDAYASAGMPVHYAHWSYGKELVRNERAYKTGRQGLAYEIVINSDPCIAYLMEENTMLMQALVIAHASYGHNAVFKGNYLFRQWTQADGILDYLVFARDYVRKCEERYGIDAVEDVLDAAHALQHHGVDRYRRPPPLSADAERRRQEESDETRRLMYDDLMARTTLKHAAEIEAKHDRYPPEPEENLLYFIEKNAPKLATWQREVVRIVRKMAQYFYPQTQTQVLNEGYATFTHYNILNRMYEKGLINDAYMMEFLHSHTNVVFQRQDPEGQKMYPINPYALGFAIYRDIQRICLHPSEEDKHWFPEFAGSKDWVKVTDFAMRNFKDESFIRQFLSPTVIRDFRFFAVEDSVNKSVYRVDAIHNEDGYRRVRSLLADQYARENRVPDIQVTQYNRLTDRSLTLTHTRANQRPLDDESAGKTLEHLANLWGFPVRVESRDPGSEARVGLLTRSPRGLAATA